MLFCPHCHEEQKSLEKISFRTICEKCGTALHSCSNCLYYKGTCTLPGTEPVRDYSAANFCEEFSAKRPEKPSVSLPKGFHDLFK